MSPLKRVAFAILGLALVMPVVGYVGTRLQRQRLSAALIVDAEALLARTIDRPTWSPSPKHENGFACLAAALATRSAYGSFASHAFRERLADEPRVPEAIRAEVELMRPWLEAIRDCGDARALKPVPGVRPFELGTQHTQALIAFSHATVAQQRVLGEDARWTEAAELCASTLELAMDQTHLDLLGALTAENVVKDVVPGCVDALMHLDAASRARISPRFAKLSARMATNRQVIEVERVEAAAYNFAKLLTDEQRARLPDLTEVLLVTSRSPLTPLLLTRFWREWDPLMRQLADHADAQGPERTDALAELTELDLAWWVPDEGRVAALYASFLPRFDDVRVLLRLLAGVAAGDENLPAGVSRTPKGLSFMTTEGRTLELPVSTP